MLCSWVHCFTPFILAVNCCRPLHMICTHVVTGKGQISFLQLHAAVGHRQEVAAFQCEVTHDQIIFLISMRQFHLTT